MQILIGYIVQYIQYLFKSLFNPPYQFSFPSTIPDSSIELCGVEGLKCNKVATYQNKG